MPHCRDLCGLSLVQGACKGYLVGSAKKKFLFFLFKSLTWTGRSRRRRHVQYGQLAQLVEHRLHTAGVVGSSPVLPTIFYGTVVKSVYNAGLSRRRPRVQVPSVPPLLRDQFRERVNLRVNCPESVILRSQELLSWLLFFCLKKGKGDLGQNVQGYF